MPCCDKRLRIEGSRLKIRHNLFSRVDQSVCYQPEFQLAARSLYQLFWTDISDNHREAVSGKFCHWTPNECQIWICIEDSTCMTVFNACLGWHHRFGEWLGQQYAGALSWVSNAACEGGAFGHKQLWVVRQWLSRGRWGELPALDGCLCYLLQG
jgi:hypothetical protein